MNRTAIRRYSACWGRFGDGRRGRVGGHPDRGFANQTLHHVCRDPAPQRAGTCGTADSGTVRRKPWRCTNRVTDPFNGCSSRLLNPQSAHTHSASCSISSSDRPLLRWISVRAIRPLVHVERHHVDQGRCSRSRSEPEREIPSAKFGGKLSIQHSPMPMQASAWLASPCQDAGRGRAAGFRRPYSRPGSTPTAAAGSCRSNRSFTPFAVGTHFDPEAVRIHADLDPSARLFATSALSIFFPSAVWTRRCPACRAAPRATTSLTASELSGCRPHNSLSIAAAIGM